MKFVYSIIIALFALMSVPAVGQEVPVDMGGDDAMRLVSSTRGIIMNQKVLRNYNPVYEHKGNTLMADSGDFRRDDLGREFFEAYGNVVITQPTGATIYADHLYYEAATQHAILTNHVRVIDAQSLLTTNYMTYNFRDQRGTYSGGGRIENGQDTITSQNAYYFERTKDSYFREDVVVRSPGVVIYTDTMRYNSVTRDNYFYGPTNIKGRGKEQNLYTESGVYNTGTGIAKFNKNNLYTENSKFLKGDSLYYDRSIGDGEAFRNVVFVDTVDKWYGTSHYGKYRSADESITLADQPLIKMVVNNDSTSQKQDTTNVIEVEDEENLSRRERRKRQREQEEKEQLRIESPIDSTHADSTKTILSDSLSTKPAPIIDTVYTTADTIFSKMIFVKDYRPLQFNLDREGGAIEDNTDVDYGDGDQDSLSLSDEIGVDSLATIEDPASKISEIADTAKKATSLQKLPATSPPIAEIDSAVISQTLEADSVLREQAKIPVENMADSLISSAIQTATNVDTVNDPVDSVLSVSDTARTRIVKAYHNVRLFKSDMQAVADSVYYGMQDSMFRFMGQPMIWSEESQASADTIYMQMVNQKLDNALLMNNAFMVNAVMDSIKFNQLKGRKMTMFFENSNIERVFVDGNAENLVFNVDEEHRIIKDMFHDKSSRIKILFQNKEVFRYGSYKSNQQVYPLKMVNQDNEILPGFVWRPQDRPKSVEDMMNRKRDIRPPADTTKVDKDSTQLDKPKTPTPTEIKTLEEGVELEEQSQENSTQQSIPPPVKLREKETKSTTEQQNSKEETEQQNTEEKKESTEEKEQKTDSY